MNAVENQVRELVDKELSAANERFPQFHSRHEGFAVILEELEELEDAVRLARTGLGMLWNDIKANQDPKWKVDSIRMSAIDAACEAIQVAAMARKFLDMEANNG